MSLMCMKFAFTWCYFCVGHDCIAGSKAFEDANVGTIRNVITEKNLAASP